MIENNELWQAFFTEVSEQLDNLELILADNDAETNADINQLFRDFHTIKSSCAMMDFHSMEKIAHASEDYLDLVRKGRTQLVAPAIAELLNGIDWLKTQLKQAKTNGTPPQENHELVEKLRTLSSSIAGQDHHIDTANLSSINESKGYSTQDRLSDDEINEFSSACRQELLIGLTPGADEKTTKRALNKLVSICNLVGFSAISSLLKKYVKIKSTGNHDRLLSVCSEIIDRITILEKSYSVDCGTLLLRELFLDTMFVDFAQLSGRLDYLLDVIEENPDDTEAITSCEDLLSKLSINASLFGYRELLNFFRYILQTIRSIRRGTISDKPTAFMAIRHALDFPVAERVQDGETIQFAKELQTRLTDLNYEISRAIHASSGESIKEYIANSINLDRDAIDLLMPDSLLRLQSALLAEKKIYEVDINLEFDEIIAESVIDALSVKSEIIHSRSIFTNNDNQKNEFSNFICFIIAVEKNNPRPDLFLRDLDIDNKCFICRDISDNEAKNDFEIEKNSESIKKPASQSNINDRHNKSISSTLRIESHILDDLITQAGELIMAHNMISHEILSKDFEDAIATGIDIISHIDSNTLPEDVISHLEAMVDSISESHQRISERNNNMQNSSKAMQSRIMDLRVIPVSSVFNRIPSLVKKMADSQGKLINLVIEGKDVRIDKGMVDILMEPLIHLVRNCIDHGIEPPSDRVAVGKPEEATLKLSAFQEGSTLALEISDNGRGINLEKIRESAVKKGFIQPSDMLSEQETCKLIFLPGFSTADVITETSGRGVGMDVVITRINHIGGDIDVQTNPGHGTRFIMTLPLSAAIQSVVMIETNSQRYAIPQSNILEIISLNHDSVSSTLGQPVLVSKKIAIPLFRLSALINHDPNATHLSIGSNLQNSIAIIIGQNSQKIGLIVDKVFSREDVFVRDLHRDLRTVPAICGATMLGNGELTFIINSKFLLQNARQASQIIN